MLVNHHVLSLMWEVWKPLLISKKKRKDFISDLHRARSVLMTHWVWAFCLKESSCDWPLELRQRSNPGMEALRSVIRASPNWKWAFKTPKADHLTSYTLPPAAPIIFSCRMKSWGWSWSIWKHYGLTELFLLLDLWIFSIMNFYEYLILVTNFFGFLKIYFCACTRTHKREQVSGEWRQREKQILRWTGSRIWDPIPEHLGSWPEVKTDT